MYSPKYLAEQAQKAITEGRPKDALSMLRKGGSDHLDEYRLTRNRAHLKVAQHCIKIGNTIAASINMLSTPKSVEDAASSRWLAERPDVSLDDVVGLDDVKRLIETRVLAPIMLKERAAKLNYKPNCSMLLYGPGGTGKSFLGRAVAGSIDAPIFDVTSSSVLSKFVGESESNVADLFKEIDKHELAVLLLDEADGLCRRRDDAKTNVLEEIKSKLDGFQRRKGRLITIACSNAPWLLDRAALSRFGHTFFVPPPGKSARLEILKKELSDTPIDDGVDLDCLARKTDGFTGRNLRDLVEDVKGLAVNRGKDSEERVIWQDFESALQNAFPSTSPGEIQRFEQWGRNPWFMEDYRQPIGDLKLLDQVQQSLTELDPEPSLADVDYFFIDAAPFAESPFFHV